MARDVEFNYTASDKTGPASASVERRMSQTGKKVEKGLDGNISKGLINAVGKVSPKLAGNLTEMLGSVGGKGGQYLAAGLVAASPLIGATISGAIIGGAGVGGVLGGVYLVSKHPAVAAAGKLMSDTLTSGLRSDAGGFVEPVLRNIDKITDRFEALRPRFRRIFDNAAKFVDPLVDGLLGGIDGITAGFDTLIARAGPVIDSISRGMTTLGQSAGESLAIISGGSEDAASALDLTFRVIGEVTRNVALLIRGLTEVYGWMDSVGTTVNDTVRGWFGLSTSADEAAKSQDKAAASTRALNGGLTALIPSMQASTVEAGENATEHNKMADAVRRATDANRALYGSEVEIAQALADANKAIGENGRNIDINSEKGRANLKVLNSTAGQLQANYDAFVAVNGVGPKSAAVADQLRAKFEALARKAGYGAAEARNLANRILGIPNKRETKLIMETAAATAKAKAIQAQLNKIPRTIPVRVIVTRQGEVTYGGGGGRQAPQMDANASYKMATDAGAGLHRTGGPAPVNVTNELAVMLDGAPFYKMTARAVDASQARSAWRMKVGRR